MMLSILSPYLLNSLFAALASLGFAVLFNVPVRYLPYTLVLAALGHDLRLLFINQGGHIVLGTLLASTFIGVCSAFLAHRFLTPMPIFAYPAVIPMVPGVYAYKAIIGVLTILYQKSPSFELFLETFKFGSLAFFIFVALALGVTTSSVILSKSSLNQV